MGAFVVGNSTWWDNWSITTWHTSDANIESVHGLNFNLKLIFSLYNLVVSSKKDKLKIIGNEFLVLNVIVLRPVQSFYIFFF